MESARRAAVARVDIYRMPIPSPDAHWTIDALRRELLQEEIRQQFIVAELARRRELEAELQRELCFYGDVRARFWQRTVPHHGASPLLHAEPLDVPRRHVKDRIEEWYQPPWSRTIDEADSQIVGAKLHKKALSGVKRKRTAEALPSICSICDVNCYCEIDLLKHVRGIKHQKNIEVLRGEGKGTEEKLHEKEAPQLADSNQKPVSRWMCSICNANCTSQFDLESHLRGRRHERNIEPLQGEGNRAEQKLHEKETPRLADNNQKPVSRWTCHICNANWTSQSDIESHLRGRRHEWNIEALQREGKGTEEKLHEKEASQLAGNNRKPVSRWTCSLCNANCTSQSDLESHLQGRRHAWNIEALQGGGKGTEEMLHQKEAPQLVDNIQKPISRWTCNICNANCTSQSDLESHLRGRRHEWNIEVLQGEGKGAEEKLHEKEAPYRAENNQKPVSRLACSICNANCTSQSDLESHLRGRRHKWNIEALQGGGKGTEEMLHEKEAPQLVDNIQKPVSRWTCSICNANCTSQSDLESHLRGRRHEWNIEALQGQGKRAEEKLHEKEAPQRVENNQKPVSRWTCSICNANCTSQSDLESHLRGRRHEWNIEALQGEGKGSEEKLYEKEAPRLADNNQKPVSRWTCSICNANCTSQSDLESHLRGRRHKWNIEALQGQGKRAEEKLHEKEAPQRVENNQKPVSRWMCSICNAYCTSQSNLESHLRGRRHQTNVQAQDWN